MTPIDLQIDQKVTMLELAFLTFGDLLADPVPKRPRIDFGDQTVISLSVKSYPLGSKSDPLGSKSDPLASKSEPLLCKSDLQL